MADTGVVVVVVGVITPPPLVAENVVCSNSNFSPTGAITPDHPPPPLVAITPPPLQKILYPRLVRPIAVLAYCSTIFISCTVSQLHRPHSVKFPRGPLYSSVDFTTPHPNPGSRAPLLWVCV